MKDLTYLSNAHPAYIEAMYRHYLNDPGGIDPSWESFFKGYDFAKSEDVVGPSVGELHDVEKEFSVLALIEGYRSRGHLLSDTNPIRRRKDRKAGLSHTDYGLADEDLKRSFFSVKRLNPSLNTLEDAIEQLRKWYCGKIGIEYMHIESNERRRWLQEKIENFGLNDFYQLSLDEKRRILEKLNGAVIFEKFLHTKYVGQKRFSLEGGEATIPALDFIIQEGSRLGVEEVIIGMAHRGRLNVLANIIGKTYEQIFSEFEGTAVPDLSFGSGDVKYHLGYSSQIETQSQKRMQLKLAPNPSHLEAVDPVVVGMARAKADILYQSNYDKILPILIHGDAAIAGQGIIYEVVQMSRLDGYYTGGTIHFVINNQIGFTTDFDDARSSTYCTAAANAIQAPVFHVNGDDPEAVVYVAKLAIAYRQEFNEDVFIDMVCYRRHGHNEGDDPNFTQPSMYEIIKDHPNVRELYIRHLANRGDLDAQLASEMERSFWSLLQSRLDSIKENPLPYKYQEPDMAWKALRRQVNRSDLMATPDTGVDIGVLKELHKKLSDLPEGFSPLPKIKRLLKAWDESLKRDRIDWGQAELLAYASILADGKNVRISGQDVKRGTFSHRHAVLYDEEHNTEYNRLSRISASQGKFFIYNSLLSELAVLGFEYGYSLTTPNHLVIWEAQFGDFANGAQVIFDQFVATAEIKWGRMTGLVMLLPHGYDGQGPEHSSARLERYLQACAENNMIVANVTTPANFFHLLRRQLAFDFRKPLVVMSPKSLLRHPDCVSKMEDFGRGTHFRPVIAEKPLARPGKIKKLVICSGQIFYDLRSAWQVRNTSDIALARVEQLYPFPTEELATLIADISPSRLVWAQEEPENMGSAAFIKEQMSSYPVQIIARPASAASAVGYKKIHDAQHKTLLEKVLS